MWLLSLVKWVTRGFATFLLSAAAGAANCADSPRGNCVVSFARFQFSGRGMGVNTLTETHSLTQTHVFDAAQFDAALTQGSSV